MSRSRRKSPQCGISKKVSEKVDKKIWHSRFRAWWREMLRRDPEYTFLDSDKHYVSDPWGMLKDGKQYIKNPSDKDMRK